MDIGDSKSGTTLCRLAVAEVHHWEEGHAILAGTHGLPAHSNMHQTMLVHDLNAQACCVCALPTPGWRCMHALRIDGIPVPLRHTHLFCALPFCQDASLLVHGRVHASDHSRYGQLPGLSCT